MLFCRLPFGSGRAPSAAAALPVSLLTAAGSRQPRQRFAPHLLTESPRVRIVCLRQGRRASPHLGYECGGERESRRAESTVP
jgi:hypothetical protein